MAQGRAGRTIGQRLAEARLSRFVGRARERAAFEALLDGQGGSVMYVYGPGGVGKSMLLAVLRGLAEEREWRTAAIDCRTVPMAAHALSTVVTSTLENTPGERRALFIDTYELAAPLDDWVRETLLPSLPDGVVVVLAGRSGPSRRWRSDPGWRDLLVPVSLRNLTADETRAYLAGAGVPDALIEPVTSSTHGHPLALSLAIELIGRDELVAQARFDLADNPDIVGTLLLAVVDEIPSPEHRHALAVCAHARFTTQALLRSVIGADRAAELFEWLRSRSFVLESPLGLYPHDLVRDVLEADTRWRDPTAFRDLHLAVYAHGVDCAQSAPDHERVRWISDVLFLNRNDPASAANWDYEALGNVYPDRMRPDEIGAMLDVIRRHEPASERAALHWLDRQKHNFLVVRDARDDLVGFALRLALHEATDDDLAADPGARAMLDYARRTDPPRPGDELAAWRFMLDVDGGHGVGTPLWTGGVIAHSIAVMTQPRLAHEFMVYRDPDEMSFAMAWAYNDRIPEADFEIDGTRFGVFFHDWRKLTYLDWVDKLSRRSMGAGDPVDVRAPREPEVLVLSEPDFAAAVRDALRDLHDDAKLAASPLLRSRLVRERLEDGDDSIAALRALIERAAAALAEQRRGDRYERAIARTYLTPAPTQELAAELLGVPFSTYRRHLKRGIDGVVQWLWHAELGAGIERNRQSEQ